MDNQMMPPVQQNVPVMQSPVLSPITPPQPVLPPDVGPKKYGDPNSLIKTIAIVILGLTTVAFICLFIYFLNQYNEINTDIQSQIDVAVADAKDEQYEKDQKDFAEREKYPYKTFAGPVDYGELSFKYPKTWSVYIASDLLKTSGDFEAYLNPGEVELISSKNSIYGLRVKIRDKAFETVVAEYQKALEKKNSNLSVESITLKNGTTANKYTGTIPNTEFSGYIIIFKIRDKTAILQTDSILFESDFNKILDSVTFNA